LERGISTGVRYSVIGTKMMSANPSSRRSSKSSNKPAKILRRAIRKSAVKEQPFVGKPVISDQPEPATAPAKAKTRDA
jgi:hypothetical protein